MKNRHLLFTLLLAFSSAHLFSEDKNIVACQGTIMPLQKISRLSAGSPMGTPAVISELNVVKGQTVKEGNIIAVIKGEKKATSSLERARAAIEVAGANMELKILQQKNMIADLEGTFAQNQKVLIEKDPPRREKEQIEYEQETLLRHIEQAKAMLPLVEKTQAALVEEARRACDEASTYYDSFIIHSPINGKVLDVHAKIGELEPQEGICEIADTSEMYVDAEVYFSDIMKIKIGDSAEILSDAIKSKVFKGAVVEISKQVKQNSILTNDPSQYTDSKVIMVKIKVENAEGLDALISSQVNVRIFTSTNVKAQ